MNMYFSSIITVQNKLVAFRWKLYRLFWYYHKYFAEYNHYGIKLLQLYRDISYIFLVN